MKKLILLILITLIIYSYTVFAVCSQGSITGNYSIDSIITATITCAASDKGDTGWYGWFNSSGDLLENENDTFTVPLVSPFVIYPSWKVTSAQAPQEDLSGNLTVEDVFISSELFNTTVSGGANDLDIINCETTSAIYEGRSAGLRCKVQNQGENVGFADICVDALDENGDPFAHLGCKKSEMDGDFFISALCDPSKGWCIGGKTALLDIDASCPLNRTNEEDPCTKGKVEIEWASGGTTKAINVIDIATKLIIFKNNTDDTEWGIWLENENSYRVNMTSNPSLTQQEDIDWNTYSEVDGSAFLTAGEKFRVCAYYNNTFDDDIHIKMSDLVFIKYPGSMVYPLCINDGSCEGKTVMHVEVKAGQRQIKCSNWMLVPPYIKGQNKYKISYHISIEDYTQVIKTNSNRFTIFGERTDTDYIDYLTINSINFTKDNATEGEYIQLEVNITANHPFKEIFTLAMFSINTNVGSNEFPIELYNYVTGTKYGTSFGIEKVLNYGTNIFLTPRLKIPYGLKDRALFDVFNTNMHMHILSVEHGDELFTQVWTGINPTIDIIDYDVEITNITTTLSNTEANACDVLTISMTYNDIISDTAAKTEEDQHYILRGCIEDTTNDIYKDCIEFEFQPDDGIDQTLNFTTTLPYTGVSGTIEAEIDVWILTYDRDNINLEEVFTFSGDEGDGTFNITATNTDACRTLKEGLQPENLKMELNYRQTVALENISEKTGKFHFKVIAPTSGSKGESMPFDIELQIEDGTLQKESKITCYIEGWRSETEFDFNHMATSSAQLLHNTINIPSVPNFPKEIHTLTCKLLYYNLGSRTDTSSDTFGVTDSIDVYTSSAGQGIKKDRLRETLIKVYELRYGNFWLFILASAILGTYVYKKYKKPKNIFEKKKERNLI